jgi:hypothetical protein
MTKNLYDSIILVTSNNQKVNHYGTGFIIYRDRNFTYVLTCAHVVENLGGRRQVEVSGSLAEIIAIGAAEDIDLAILGVVGLWDKPALGLQAVGAKEKPVVIAGFQQFGKHFLLRPLRAKLGEQVGLESGKYPGRIGGWDLKIEGEYRLELGYSGSPVIDPGSNHVLGVATYRQGQGEKGLAISIDVLQKVWLDSPFELPLGGASHFVESFRTVPASSTSLQMARRALAILEQQAAGYTILDIPPRLQIQLEEKRKEVAELEARLRGEREQAHG